MFRYKSLIDFKSHGVVTFFLLPVILFNLFYPINDISFDGSGNINLLDVRFTNRGATCKYVSCHNDTISPGTYLVVPTMCCDSTVDHHRTPAIN